MANLPIIALGAWAWGNDGTFGNSLTADNLDLNVIRFWEKEMKQDEQEKYRSNSCTVSLPGHRCRGDGK